MDLYSWIAVGGAALLVIGSRLPLSDWLAKLKGGAVDLIDDDDDDAPGLLDLQEHWQRLTLSLDEAGEPDAAKAMREVVAPALGRMAFRVEVVES